MKKVFQVSAPAAPRRRGAIAVLMAVLMIPLLAFVAFCVDIGWVTSTKSELQNAADSAAAAGARQLVNNYGVYASTASSKRQNLINGAEQNATTYSRRFSGHNEAGGVTSLNMLPEDVQFGFTDASGNFQPSSARPGYPNTVQVLARRDGGANGRLPLFFAAAIGHRDTALTAAASSTIYTGLITSFGPPRQVPGRNGGGGVGVGVGEGPGGDGDGAWGDDYWNDGVGFHCGLLPVAFDVNTWNLFFASGASPDGLVYADDTGTPEIKIYPSPQQAPGNFGLLCIGTPTNATPDFQNWILNGPCVADLQSLASSDAFPVSQESPRPWKGTPGLRSTLRSDFAAIIGQPRLLPLFQPASTTPYQAASGAGSNASYNIVGFVGVMVTKVTGSGGNLDITVQPCSVLDPTAVFDPATIVPAGAEPSSQLKTFTFVSPKFSR